MASFCAWIILLLGLPLWSITGKITFIRSGSRGRCVCVCVCCGNVLKIISLLPCGYRSIYIYIKVTDYCNREEINWRFKELTNMFPSNTLLWSSSSSSLSPYFIFSCILFGRVSKHTMTSSELESGKYGRRNQFGFKISKRKINSWTLFFWRSFCVFYLYESTNEWFVK